MSHVTIIISRRSSGSLVNSDEHEPKCTYHYEIPIPHDATPAQVGEMARKAYKRLEGIDQPQE